MKRLFSAVMILEAWQYNVILHRYGLTIHSVHRCRLLHHNEYFFPLQKNRNNATVDQIPNFMRFITRANSPKTEFWVTLSNNKTTVASVYCDFLPVANATRFENNNREKWTTNYAARDYIFGAGGGRKAGRGE